MESITVYQKIPHPGIQVSLNSYYSKQVGGTCRESSGGAGTKWWRLGGGAQTLCVVPTSPAMRLPKAPSPYL